MVFQPSDGVKSGGTKVYEYFCQSIESWGFGSVSYWELSEILGTDDRVKIRSSVRVARKRLITSHSLIIWCAYNIGYFAVDPHAILRFRVPDRRERERIRSARNRKWGNASLHPPEWFIDWFLESLNETFLSWKIAQLAFSNHPDWQDAGEKFDRAVRQARVADLFTREWPTAAHLGWSPEDLWAGLMGDRDWVPWWESQDSATET